MLWPPPCRETIAVGSSGWIGVSGIDMPRACAAAVNARSTTGKRPRLGVLEAADGGGVGVGLVADRVGVEVGFRHAERVPDLVQERRPDLLHEPLRHARRTDQRQAVKR